MSYSFIAYAVDLEKLREVFGSKDPKLAKAIAKKCKQQIEDNDESFEEEIEEGAPTLVKAMEQIIEGKPGKKSAHAFQYGYAVEVLCAYFGERIDGDEVGGQAYDIIDPVLKKAKQPDLTKLLCEQKFPVPIPKPNDFPLIGTLDAAAITKLVKACDAIKPLLKKGDDATEVASALRTWAQKATKAKRGIVVFVY